MTEETGVLLRMVREIFVSVVILELDLLWIRIRSF